MEKLVKIGRFQAESPELAREVAETLINTGFITSIDDEFDCTVVVYKKIKNQ